MRITALVLLVAVALVWCSGCRRKTAEDSPTTKPVRQAEPRNPVLDEADPVASITFIYASWDGPPQEVIISDRESVDEIVGKVQCRKRQICDCAHLEEIVFTRASGRTIRADVCDHCFNLGRGASAQYYTMPKELYAVLEAHRPGGMGD